MIEAKQIQQNYRVIYGDYDPAASYDAVVAHCHFTGDTSSRLPRMVRAAHEAGIDRLTVTDHNSTRAHEKVQGVIDRKGYALQMIPGVEVTARSSKLAPRHVLVYGAHEAPPSGLSVQEVNAWAHALEGDTRTAVAHPELWNFSVMRDELTTIQASPDPNERFDFGEIVNGAVMRVDALRRKHPHIAHLLRNHMPAPDANNTMLEVAHAHDDTLSFIGGSDAHEWDGIDNVVNLVPEGMDLFAAVDTGSVVILQRKDPKPLPFWRIGVTLGKELPERLVEGRNKRAGTVFEAN